MHISFSIAWLLELHFSQHSFFSFSFAQHFRIDDSHVGNFDYLPSARFYYCSQQDDSATAEQPIGDFILHNFSIESDRNHQIRCNQNHEGSNDSKYICRPPVAYPKCCMLHGKLNNSITPKAFNRTVYS